MPEPEDQFNISDDAIIIEGAEEEIADAGLLDEDPDDYGPMETHLFTEGGEFWLRDQVQLLNAQFDHTSAFTDANSYSGWYHVRNHGSQYEIVVPTKEFDASYEGELMYTKYNWLMKHGLVSQANEVSQTQIKGCTNPDAFNYNPLANDDDGSCWVIPGFLLGHIPPETMNNLHTSGGELVLDENMNEYKGYYHVHGPGDLPTFANGTLVTAGMILTGPEFNGLNKLLRPVNIENRFNTYHTTGEEAGLETEGGSYKMWNDIKAASEDSYTGIAEYLNEGKNGTLDIVVDTTSGGANKDFIAFDNYVTMAKAVSVMKETDYQFNHLLDDDTRAPGIYGRKPKMKSNINEIEFTDIHVDGGGGTDRTALPARTAEAFRGGGGGSAA